MLIGGKLGSSKRSSSEFRPFNAPLIVRAADAIHDDHEVYEVAWQCPECSHNSLASAACRASGFDPEIFAGKNEFCPNCAQSFEGKAEGYFLGPLARPAGGH